VRSVDLSIVQRKQAADELRVDVVSGNLLTGIEKRWLTGRSIADEYCRKRTGRPMPVKRSVTKTPQSNPRGSKNPKSNESRVDKNSLKRWMMKDFLEHQPVQGWKMVAVARAPATAVTLG
jgi:hypothetical protein